MQYNDDSQLDTSAVPDARSGGIGKGGLAIGGGGLGIVGVIVVVLLNVLGGGGSGTAVTDVLGQLGTGTSTQPNGRQHGAEAGMSDRQGRQHQVRLRDRRRHRFDPELLDDRAPELGAKYTPVNTVWFTGQVNTACGGASSAAGPFYCPADKLVYIDLGSMTT